MSVVPYTCDELGLITPQQDQQINAKIDVPLTRSSARSVLHAPAYTVLHYSHRPDPTGLVDANDAAMDAFGY